MGDNHFAMVSEWMANGNIKEFLKVHRDANRFELVSFSFIVGLLITNNRLTRPAPRCCSGVDIYA